jgi:hypothetical protein
MHFSNTYLSNALDGALILIVIGGCDANLNLEDIQFQRRRRISHFADSTGLPMSAA